MAAGGIQHISAERADQTGFFRNADELERRDHAAQRVLPAHQRLEACDAAVAEVGDGLVDDEQFTFLDRQSQFAFQARAFAGALFHRRLEEAMARAAAALCLSHREARILQHCLGFDGATVPHQHPDTDGAVYRNSANRVRLVQRVHEASRHAFGQSAHVEALHRFEQDNEFVDTESRRGLASFGLLLGPMALAQCAVDARAHQAQQIVAGGLTQVDIDPAEAVGVDQQHDETVVGVFLRRSYRALDTFQHHGAVGHGGQRVDTAGVSHLVGNVLALQAHVGGDVGHAAHQQARVQAKNTQRERQRHLVALGWRTHGDAQAVADVPARPRRRCRQRLQLRRCVDQHVEQVAQVALRGQRHQQLRRHRVDHHDLAVQRRLYQADRRLIKELHQGFLSLPT